MLRLELTPHASRRAMSLLLLGVTTVFVTGCHDAPALSENEEIHITASSDQVTSSHGTSVLDPPTDVTIQVPQAEIASYTVDLTAQFWIAFTTGSVGFGSEWTREISRVGGSVLYSASTPLFSGTQYDTTYSQGASFTPGAYGSYTLRSKSVLTLCDPIVGCTSEPVEDQVTVSLVAPVTSVTVAPATASVYEFATLVGITATPRDQNGQVVPGKVATWTSSDPSIATVTSTGNLTADVHGVGAGTATITATIDGVSGAASVTVLRQRFARPDSDIDNPGLWSPTPSNWQVWQTLSEPGTPSDNTLVATSFSGGQSKSFTVGLSNLNDPQSSAGHVIRARARYRTSGAAGNLTVELMQGATVKATLSTDLTTVSFQTFTYTLTAAEANSITDYTDLRLRVTHTLYAGGPVTVDCSWLEFEVP